MKLKVKKVREKYNLPTDPLFPENPLENTITYALLLFWIKKGKEIDIIPAN